MSKNWHKADKRGRRARRKENKNHNQIKGDDKLYDEVCRDGVVAESLNKKPLGEKDFAPVFNSEFFTEKKACKPSDKNRRSNISRRWVKHIYTAALRLGCLINEDKHYITYMFTGKCEDQSYRKDHQYKYQGDLEINGIMYKNIYVVINNNYKGIVTFYPNTQHMHAVDSTTDPLVELYLEDAANGKKPDNEYSVETVADYYHSVFKKNPGVNPSRIMNELYSGLSEETKQRIDNLDNELIVERLKCDEYKEQLNDCESKLTA
ncbi:MAG TPA: hypothetical protein EYQ06_09700 [Flavobacteriales bacterium]|jgi:hypothetical protein|nr:hypothetical protein [Flavobacteriales bacterium]